MKLYIAEKPSVGRAIAESLGGSLQPVRGSKGPTHIRVGGDVVVTWVFGHILELCPPERYDPSLSSWTKSAAQLPVLPDAWKLEPTSGGGEQIGIIASLLKEADSIVHAGDPDREGQLLVDEVLDYLGNRKPVQRILPNAIDVASMKRILGDVRSNHDFLGLYRSAQGRQRADWMVGMNFTRSCTLANQRSGMRGVLSVGRVQTPTLAMIVARDLEIERFKPSTFFGISGLFKHANGTYVGRWKPLPGQKGLDKEGRLIDEVVATALQAAIAGKTGKIVDYKVEDCSQPAPLPFSLSSLQSKASAAFGMGAKKVLDICQSLYEVHKVASYPRTDCQFLPLAQYAEAPGVLHALRSFDGTTATLVGQATATLKSRAWNDKQVTAHHAIIPTANANYAQMSADERKVFGLIVKHYLAQFYPAYRYKQTSVLTECAGQQFVASGRTPVDMGWRQVFGAELEPARTSKPGTPEEDNQTLPAMKQGDAVVCEKVLKDKKQTKPPKHFTEGTLIHAMTNVHETVDDPEMRKKLKEVKGIGTEATRASFIETLKKRLFIEIRGGNIVSTAAGREFVRALPPELVDVAMTALWEHRLDKVEDGSLRLEEFMANQREFVTRMTRQILGSTISVAIGLKEGEVSQAMREGAGGTCPRCTKGVLRLLQAQKGPNAGNYFLGCTFYPECRHTAAVAPREGPVGTPPAATGKAASARGATKPRAGGASGRKSVASGARTPAKTPSRAQAPSPASSTKAPADFLSRIRATAAATPAGSPTQVSVQASVRRGFASMRKTAVE